MSKAHEVTVMSQAMCLTIVGGGTCCGKHASWDLPDTIVCACARVCTRAPEADRFYARTLLSDELWTLQSVIVNDHVC